SDRSSCAARSIQRSVPSPGGFTRYGPSSAWTPPASISMTRNMQGTLSHRRIESASLTPSVTPHTLFATRERERHADRDEGGLVERRPLHEHAHGGAERRAGKHITPVDRDG